MHNFNQTLLSRVVKPETRLADVLISRTPAEIERGRMLEFCAAAVQGRQPEDLEARDRDLFAQIRRYVPVYLELLESGMLNRELPAVSAPEMLGDSIDHDLEGRGDERDV
jgi:hypothetical protein